MTTTIDWLTTIDSNDTDTEHLDSHSSSHEVPTAILFIFVACAVGAFVRTLFKKVPLPYTVILLLFGSVIGIISRNVTEVSWYTTMARMDPHTILHVFLPVLIFESAFAMDVHAFVKSSLQIVTLAIPGMGIAAILTALFAMNVFSYNWGWTVGMMFGAIISATDPVAVVALLKDLGASKHLAIVIEGESLLNDGAAIVLFNVFKTLSIPGQTMDAVEIVVYFIRVALCGPLFGFAIAKLTVLWLKNIFNDALTEITITLAATYITFFIGEEFLKVSGVLAVVAFGVTLSAERTSISPEVDAFLERFWEMLAYLANTLIFILVGVVITENAVQGVDTNDWILMIALYCAINIIRCLVFVVLSPILRKMGYGLTLQNATIMIWGGLRGAVGLALALIVSQEHALDATGTMQRKILLHASGIVLLTLLINATTISSLLRALGMSDISTAKRLAMASAVRNLQDVVQTSIVIYKSDRFLADADWDIVEKNIDVQDPYYTLDEEAELDDLTELGQQHSTCPNCDHSVPNQPTKRELDEMRGEACRRLLKAEKTSYWKQFEHGMLSREAVRKLQECVDTACDEEHGLIDLQEIKRSWNVRGIFPYMINKLDMWRKGKLDDIVPAPDNKCQEGVYKMCLHQAFDAVIFVFIFINCIAVIVEFVAESKLCADELKEKYGYTFDVMNYFFLFIYFLEAVFKIIAFRKYYFLNRWNQFDLAILILSFVDLILDFTVFKDAANDCDGESTSSVRGFDPSLLRVARIVRLLRVLRSLRLVKGLIPQLIDTLNKQLNKQLRFGYDVGKGYIMGEEEVYNFIDLMVDEKQIAAELKHRVIHGRLDIIKEMGKLQKEHPGIAVSVKTQQATRRILNNVREKINALRGEGVLDDTEAHKLEIMVETRMKKLLKMPASIKPPPPERVIKNLSWVQNDQLLTEYITNNARLITMVEGEQVFAEGDPKGGIYIVVSGLLKVEGSVEDNSHYEELKHDTKYMQDVHEHKDTMVAAEPTTGKTSDRISDYLTTGSIIGEIALLTSRPRSATITCDTAATLYHIPYEAMQGALDLFTGEPTLEERLWRVCAIRITTGVLKNHFAFKGWSQEKIKVHLEKSILYLHKRDIDRERKFGPPMFEINSVLMMDILLIHGICEGVPDKQIYVGPCYIPNTLDALVLVPGRQEEHVFLVVPRGNALHRERATSEANLKLENMMANQQSSKLCLHHAVEHRHELEAKISHIRTSQANLSVGGSIANLARKASRALSSAGLRKPSSIMGSRHHTRIEEAPVTLDESGNVVNMDQFYPEAVDVPLDAPVDAPPVAATNVPMANTSEPRKE